MAPSRLVTAVTAPFDEAVHALQQYRGTNLDWPEALAMRLRDPAGASSELRRVLERHGWAAVPTLRGGQSWHFKSPPDRERLLRDLVAAHRDVLAAAARECAAAAATVAGPTERPVLQDIPDDVVRKCEEERFRRQYTIEEVAVGEGTYGAVYKAFCSASGRTVAAKKVKSTNSEEGVPSTAIREVAVLKATRHPNIVKLLDVCCWPGTLYLIFEFVPMNLKQHMKRFARMKIDKAAVKSLLRQLLHGMDFCHSKRIIHRDLKPQNLLVDDGTATGDGLLKIADFGMARAFCVPIPRYTHEVVTTWYRAPEILFGCEEYALPVDIWSVGCIFGEMTSGAPLFHGDSEIDTIFQIFQKLGTPSEAEWPGLSALPLFKPSFPQWRRRSWEDIRGIASSLGPAGTQLLDEMVRYDPLRRATTRSSLESAYFTEGAQASVGTPPGEQGVADMEL